MNDLRRKYFSVSYGVVVSPLPTQYEESDITPLINQEEISVLCPINEHGLIGDVLRRALSSQCSPILRDNLLSMLEVTSTGDDSRYSDLPDDVRLNLVKLRSCQSPSEMSKYINALSSWFEANNITAPKPTDDVDPKPTDDVDPKPDDNVS